MPDPSSGRWQSAVDTVRGRLTKLHGVHPMALGRKILSGYHHQWRIAAGWRMTVDFGEPTPRRMDILIPQGFPFAWPRIALVDRPRFLTWPHVERDGTLCLLSNRTEVDPGDPAGIVVDLLGRACRLVRDLIAGAMVERDFRDEFLTYWRYDKNIKDSRLTSILAAEGPSREVCVWQAPNIRLIGETEAEIRRWLGNRFGPQALRRPYAERAMMIWLDEPMLPSEYPRNARDLLLLAESAGPDVSALLSDIALARQEHLTTVIGAVGRFGPGLVTVTVPSPGHGKLRHGVCSAPVDRGFRPSHLPPGLLIDRTFGIEPVYRSEPARADAAWIHGRGQDARSARLKEATVTLLGCGSVGAPIAVALAQAGVGRIKLVDYDELAWANVGRHPLGATSVGRNKAVSLAAKLQSDYPHGTFEAFPVHAAAFLSDVDGNWLGSDLIISAMGSWLAEAHLNDLHCLHGRPMPAIYAWTEANAAAGHAVVVTGHGGCLRCGIGRTGVPAFQVTSWPDGGSGAMEEPACGAHYQAYGPIELGFITALAGQTALDTLLGRITVSHHRMYITRRALLEDAGGRWSVDFATAYPAYLDGGCTEPRRVFRRPQLLRGWSHDEATPTVFP